MEKLIVEGVDLTGFLNVPYNALRHPGNTSRRKFFENKQGGANCELFALAVVSHGGMNISRMRSIELWEDEVYTSDLGDPGEAIREGNVKLWDIFLFLPKGADPHKVAEEVRRLKTKNSGDLSELKKFHQAVYIGLIEKYGAHHCLIHLPLETGRSVVWPLDYFAKSAKEYYLFKIKRPLILHHSRRPYKWDPNSFLMFPPII